MLTEFRKYARNIGTKILLGLLVITFGIWGVEDMIIKPSSNNTVATVGGIDISTIEFQRNMTRETEKLKQMLGSKYSPEILKYLGFSSQILQRLVDSRLLVLESKNLGIKISDAEIAENIKKNREFFDEKGVFNKQVFEAILRRDGLTEKSYIEKLRSDLAVRILLETIKESISPPQNAAPLLISSRDERRKVEVYTISPSIIKDISTPDDKTLQEYYKEHITEFTSPEYRTISYIVVTEDDAKKYLAQKTEKDPHSKNIEEIYRERISEFKKPERRKIDQLLFGNEEAAKKAYDSIKSGKSFTEASKDSNILNPKAISLGIVEKYTLMEEAAEKVFSLEKGAISEPVKSSFGWHIFKIEEIIPASVQPLEEVKPRIEKEIQQQANQNAFYDLSNNIEDIIAGGGTISEAAKEFSLKLITLPPLDKNGLLENGTLEKDLPKDDKFLETAFKSEENTESSLINGKNGISYMLRVDKITAEQALPFQDIKTKVIASWLANTKKERLQTLANKISGEFANPADRAKIIQTYSIPEPTTVIISQKKGDAKIIPEKIIPDIFIHSVGDSSQAFEKDNGSFGIAVLKEILPVSHDTKDEKYMSSVTDINKEYKNTLQSEVIDQYLRYIATKYHISINSSAVDLVNSEQ